MHTAHALQFLISLVCLLLVIVCKETLPAERRKAHFHWYDDHLLKTLAVMCRSRCVCHATKGC